MKNIIKYILLIFLVSYCYSTEKPKLIFQDGHLSGITAVKISPNEKIFATGSKDQTIKLWDLETGLLLHTLVGHKADITDISFSNSGDSLATSSPDKTIRIWDTKTGGVIKVISNSQSSFTSVDFHPYNRMLLSSSLYEISIWDLTKDNSKADYWNQSDPINNVKYLPDGNHFAYGGDDKILYYRKISLAKKKDSEKLIGHKDKITCISFNNTGSIIASRSKDNEIIIWDISKQQIINKLKGYSNKICLSKDSRDILATTDSTNKIIIISRINGRTIRSLNGHESYVNCIDINASGNRLVSGSIDGTIIIWDLEHGRLLNKIEPRKYLLAGLIFDDKNHRLITSINNKLFFWDIKSGKEPQVLTTSIRDIQSFDINKDKTWLITGGINPGGCNSELINLHNNSLIQQATTAGYTSLTKFNTRNDIIACVSEDSLLIRSVPVGNILHSYSISNFIMQVEFHPKRDLALIVDFTNSIELWDFHNNSKYTMSNPSYDICKALFSSTGDSIICGTIDGKIKIILTNDLNQKLIEMDAHKNRQVTDIRINSKGNLIISGGYDNCIRIMDLQNNLNLVHEINNTHSNIVKYTLFINDTLAASASTDGIIKIWNTGSTASLTHSLFSLDDNWVVVNNEGYFDGSAEGLSKFHWVYNNNAILIESYFNKFYYPSILQIYNDISHPEQNIQTKAIAGIVYPPVVSLLSPLSLDTMINDFVQITVEAVSMSFPVSEICIYQNCKLVRRELFPVPYQNITFRDFKLYLKKGINKITIKAFDNNGYESHPISFELYRTGKKEKENLYIMSIGISDYSNDNLNLNYAHKDADSIASVIQRFKLPSINQCLVYKMINQEATKKNVIKTLNEIANKSKKNDNFIFYFSGHGNTYIDKQNNNSEFNIILNDKKGTETISSCDLVEYFEKIQADKQLIIIDACYSSGLVDILFKRDISKFARKSGISAFASASIYDKAYEQNILGHGVFTFSVLEGLKGKAKNNDEYVHTLELQSYIISNVPELSLELLGKEQIPILRSEGLNFPISFINR
ncbi:caspase family protein [Bacteroidota bacterium]